MNINKIKFSLLITFCLLLFSQNARTNEKQVLFLHDIEIPLNNFLVFAIKYQLTEINMSLQTDQIQFPVNLQDVSSESKYKKNYSALLWVCDDEKTVFIYFPEEPLLIKRKFEETAQYSNETIALIIRSTLEASFFVLPVPKTQISSEPPDSLPEEIKQSSQLHKTHKELTHSTLHPSAIIAYSAGPISNQNLLVHGLTLCAVLNFNQVLFIQSGIKVSTPTKDNFNGYSITSNRIPFFAGISFFKNAEKWQPMLSALWGVELHTARAEYQNEKFIKRNPGFFSSLKLEAGIPLSSKITLLPGLGVDIWLVQNRYSIKIDNKLIPITNRWTATPFLSLGVLAAFL